MSSRVTHLLFVFQMDWSVYVWSRHKSFPPKRNWHQSWAKHHLGQPAGAEQDGDLAAGGEQLVRRGQELLSQWGRQLRDTRRRHSKQIHVHPVGMGGNQKGWLWIDHLWRGSGIGELRNKRLFQKGLWLYFLLSPVVWLQLCPRRECCRSTCLSIRTSWILVPSWTRGWPLFMTDYHVLLFLIPRAWCS